MANRPFISPVVTVFLVFAAGVAIAVLGALLADNVQYARARYTVWPCIALGGWAVAILISQAPNVAGTNWRTWWIAGLVAYFVHLWFGFVVIYGASVVALYWGQGWLVATANLALLVLWIASALAAVFGHFWMPLHVAATVLFVITTFASTVIFAVGWARYGGIAIALVWLAAGYWRYLRARPLIARQN